MTTLSSILPPISLASATGTLPVGNGGTGVTTSTGAGSVVLSEGPSITLGNATGLPLTTGVTGTLPVANGGTGAATLTGVVKGNGENAFTAGTVSVSEGGTGAVTLTGVVKGTGTSALTAGTVSLTAEVSGTLPVANGGTGAATLAANNVLLGNGTSAVQAVAPGASGNVLTSNGTTWASAAAVSGVQQFTSSGSITAGQPVALNTDGTVSTVTGVNNPEAVVAQDVVDSNAAGQNCLGTFYDPNNDWTIFAKRLPFQSVFNVSAFRINSAGNVSIFGSNSINYTDTSVSGNMPVRIIRTGTNRYAVMYANNAFAQFMGLFTINASTGALTNIGQASFGGYNSSVSYDMDYEPVSDRIITVTKNASNNVTVEAVNPANGTKTASAQFSTTPGAGDTIAVACHTTSGQFLLAFCDIFTSGCYFRTATINSAGTTITFVSTPGYGFGTSQLAAMAYAPSIDRYMFLSVSSGQLSCVAYNTSGSQVFTGGITFTSGSASTNPQKSMINDTLQLLQTITSTGSTSGLQYGQRSYTASAFGIGSVSGYFPSALSMARGSFSPTATLGIYVYTSPDQGGAGTSTRAIAFRPALLSTNADRFIGFSTQSVSTGAAVTVTTLGGVNTNQSALTTNATYYIQLTGALSTTPSSYGIVARALSATSVQVTTGGAFKKLLSQTVIAGSPTSLSFTLPSGYTQFELAFQNVVGGSNASPVVQSATSGGSGTYYSGKGQAFLGSSSPGSYTQGGTILYLTGNQTHSSGSPFGGSLLIQSSASTAYWSYQLMTNFNNGGDSYFSGAGWFNNIPANITLSGFGTLTNGGVVTLYGIG